MRHISGPGSDNDRSDETLRKRKNAVGEKSGDDDVVLPGPFSVPLIVIIHSARLVRPTGGRNRIHGRSDLGVAMMMMLMSAEPRGSGGAIAMRGLGQLTESRAHMMIVIDEPMMVRLGGQGWQALATHAPPRPMADANISAQRVRARPPTILGVITNRTVLGRRSKGGLTIGRAPPTVASTVQAQPTQAKPAFQPSPGAARGANSGESGLADGDARTPMGGGGGGSGTSRAPLFGGAQRRCTPATGWRITNLLRSPRPLGQGGRR